MLECAGATRDDLPEGRLAEIFRAQLDEVSRWLGDQEAITLLEVDYAALVAEPAAWSASIDSFLGGWLDRAAMANVVDPRLWRQRRAST
jgi:hypothetical protein